MTSTDSYYLTVPVAMRARDVSELRTYAPAVMAWLDVTFEPIETARDGEPVLPVTSQAKRDGTQWRNALFTLQDFLSPIHLRRRMQIYRKSTQGWVRCRVKDW